MYIETKLDALHAAVTRNGWLQLFTAFTRCLVALAFIPPSIPKILHRPFTVLPDSNPVGHYFNALYATGFYYEFIGWSQLTAAILLLIPRTSHIGALLFLPIIVNIAVLTTSVGFVGTWVITILMALAGAWIVAWEYDRLKPIIFADRNAHAGSLGYRTLGIPIFFCAGGVVMAWLWSMIRLGNFASYWRVAGVLALVGFGFGTVMAIHHRFMPVGSLREDTASG